MSNFKGTQGDDFLALYKSSIQPRPTRLDTDSMLKLWNGGDLMKAKRPPQSDNADDAEDVGSAGQRIGGTANYAGAGQGPGGKRKRRADVDENGDERPRRLSRPDDDEDDEELDDDTDDQPNRHKHRDDESGRFASRAKKLDKMLAKMYARGGVPVAMDALMDPTLEKLDGGGHVDRLTKRARQVAVLERATNMADLARRGYRPSIEQLAECTAAIRDALNC